MAEQEVNRQDVSPGIDGSFSHESVEYDRLADVSRLAPPLITAKAASDVTWDFETAQEQADMARDVVVIADTPFTRADEIGWKFFARLIVDDWRALSVTFLVPLSPDDRSAQEKELANITTMTDKFKFIWFHIRDSLPDIAMLPFPKMTNLGLTFDSDGQLHINVREDVIENLSFPLSACVDLDCPQYFMRDVRMIEHLGGIRFKVSIGTSVYEQRILICPDDPDKPDKENQMWYEAYFFTLLRHSEHVNDLCGVIVSDDNIHVRALWLNHAEKGSLRSALQRARDTVCDIPWSLRETWAVQLVRGIIDVHEAGMIMKTVELDDVMIFANDRVRWSKYTPIGFLFTLVPPELERALLTCYRIGWLTGTKTDVWFLGIVLWSIATLDPCPQHSEEWERDDMGGDDVPGWYREVVRSCLQRRPHDRKNAAELLTMIPERLGGQQKRIVVDETERWTLTHVGLDDLTLDSNSICHSDGQEFDQDLVDALLA